MPKGEYDTPGPFRIGQTHLGDHMVMREGQLKALFIFWSAADKIERKYMVDLLNKGTHFDEMLAALKEAYGLPDYVGIDETEVGEKELVVSCEIWRERWGEMIAKLTGQSTD